MATTANTVTEPMDRAAESEEAAASAKKRRIRFVAMGALGVAALGVVAWYVAHAGLESTDDAQIDTDVYNVPSQVAGTVRWVRFEENQRVKAGDLLVELDSSEPKARLDQAQAQLAADKAAADAAEADVAIIEANATGQKSVAEATLRGSSVSALATGDRIAQADAQVRQQSVARDQAKVDLDRVKQLFDQRAVPRQTLDDAQSRFDAADAALVQSRAQQSFVRASQAEAQSRVAEASARVKQSGAVSQQIAQARARAVEARAKADMAAAVVSLAQLGLEHTRILAPHDGVASKKSVVLGQVVTPGQPVVSVVPVDDVWVTANFKETQLSKMRPGQSVELEVDAYPGAKLHGTVQSFSGATGARFSLLPPENATGNFTKVVQRVPVRIKLDAVPEDRPLRPGMSVEAIVDTRH
jgi:membrane fusion protein (multidrug efflux system)